MSLYGALFSGVAGLRSQANKLGVISDNVANVNTVGYKGSVGSFETLVTSSSVTAAYSPGGVLGGNRQLVSRQGLLQATDSATDIAISGKGFFVVNTESSGTGQVSYTRAGSFRADATGNFRNAAGYYLQAWPLDGAGRLPGQPGNTNTTSSANITSLRVVNVQNLTGVAAATTNVSVGANLNSSQTIFAGAAGEIGMDSLSTVNFGIPAKSIIVPTAVNGIERGDKFTITTGNGLEFTYRYGGFTYGRNITDGTNGESDIDLENDSTNFTGSAANPFEFTDGSNVVTVNHADHGLVTGDVITLSGNTSDLAGIPSAQFNGKFLVTVVDEDSYTITVSTAASVVDLGANPVTTTLGANPTVTVNLGSTSHGFAVGQQITFSGADTVNGVDINDTWTIATVSGANITFTATGETAATTTVATASAFTTTLGANPTVTLNVGAGNPYEAGQQITIAGASPLNGVDLNGTWTIATSSGSNITFVATGETAAVQDATGLNVTYDVDPGAVSTATIDLGSDAATLGYFVGQSLALSGLGTINGVAITNGNYTLTAVTGNTISFAITGTSGGGGATPAAGGTISMNAGGGAVATHQVVAGGGATGADYLMANGGGLTITSVTRPYEGNIMDATNVNTRFLATTGTAGFTSEALTFKVTTAATGTVTFTYTNAAPDIRQKQFNNLTNLAAAINEIAGLSARVVDNKLYVGATDANAAVTFANGSAVGTAGPPVQAGIDWVRELGLQNITAGTDRFSSLEGLKNLAVTASGISASIENPLGAATLSINVDDPTDTITFSDSPTQAALAAFTSSTPFASTLGSNVITVSHPSAHSFSTGDFVELDASALASTATLGTDAFTTTNGANSTVTVDVTGTSQTYVVGQTITIAGATAVNGVDVNGTWTITAVSGDDVSFATTQTATGTAAGGGAAASSAYGSFNGIDLADLSGRFEIAVTSSTEYTVRLANDVAATAAGSFGAAGLVVTPHNNQGSLLAEFGLVDSLNGALYSVAGPQTTTAEGPSYSPTDSTLNMASGSVAPHFSRPIRIFDALGTGHDMSIAFLKTGVNTWSIEVFAIPETDVTTSLPDGLLFYGDVVFNGDGTLREVASTLADALDITWTNGASSSSVQINWGTPGQIAGTPDVQIGQADGLSQFNASYQVSFVNQNGAPVGELTGVSITEEGLIVASYSNGETQALFKIPLADFANPDQLTANSGNVFLQSADSGEVNLREAGTSGVGTLAASSLEESNVELSQELTDMIIAQRSYQANAKVISTSDNMLEELNRIIN